MNIFGWPRGGAFFAISIPAPHGGALICRFLHAIESNPHLYSGEFTLTGALVSIFYWQKLMYGSAA